jgi:3-isopropylmalate/(R)-2-methylmalate dehydratase large subunit
VAVVSHVIPTHPSSSRDRRPASALQATNLKKNCDHFGIPLFDTNDALQGIEHVSAPEHGMIRPGMVVICGDSHTTTYGALGALGFGIGTTEVEHVLATQTLVYRVARDMRIRIDGTLPVGTTAKDLVLAVIGRIGAQGARGYVVEYCGSAIDALSIEARFTLCNMTVEAGSRGALVAPDRRPIDYVMAHAPDIAGLHREAALAAWKDLRSDDGAISMRAPLRRRRGGTPGHLGHQPRPGGGGRRTHPAAQDCPRAGAQQRRPRAALHQAAGRARHRRHAGAARLHRLVHQRPHRGPALPRGIVRGRHVAAGVRAMVVPGSGAVKAAAEAEGLDRSSPRRASSGATRLLDVPGDERRRARRRRALRLDHQPQLRRTPGPRCDHAPDEPGHGRRGGRHGRITDVRRLETLQ